jgi:hypothetical protein
MLGDDAEILDDDATMLGDVGQTMFDGNLAYFGKKCFNGLEEGRAGLVISFVYIFFLSTVTLQIIG